MANQINTGLLMEDALEIVNALRDEGANLELGNMLPAIKKYGRREQVNFTGSVSCIEVRNKGIAYDRSIGKGENKLFCSSDVAITDYTKARLDNKVYSILEVNPYSIGNVVLFYTVIIKA